MFSLGVYLVFFGYAAVYTGIANLLNGGNGPTYGEALGFQTMVAPPGADKPNLTGQPAVVGAIGGKIGGKAK